jgi:hypothetical protein
MAYTRANAETSLVSRLGGKMALVGFAITTVGSNAALDDPLAVALRKMGHTASNPVTDGNLAGLTDAEIDELLNRAELRLLGNIAGNIDLTDIQVGPRRESLGQLAEQCEKAIARLSKSIEREFGAGLSGLNGGSLMLDFQETVDDEQL